MKLSYWFLCIATIIVVSCSNEIRMTLTIRDSLRSERQILAVHYLPSPFTAQTPEVRNAGSSEMMLGAIGGAIAGATQTNEAHTSGSQLVKEYHLEDPMLTIKRSFLEDLSQNGNIQNLNSVENALVHDSLDALRRTFQKGLVFDFKTTSWSLIPAGPLSPNRYRTHYAGRARLLRFPEGRIEWQGVCEADGRIEDFAPTLLEVVANSGAVLKLQLKNASQECLVQLKKQFLTE